jgi:DNA-binding NarL/FixJ family response regulator
MRRVFLADSLDIERIALNLLLKDLKMEVVGEAADWSSTLTHSPIRRTDMLVVEWNLLPKPANAALKKAREAYPDALIVALTGRKDAGQQAALSAGADAVVSKSKTLDQLVKGLRAAAERISGAGTGR